MPNKQRPRMASLRSNLLIAIAILAMISPGCSRCDWYRLGNRCADIERGSVPEPAGAKLQNWESLQVSEAQKDLTTLYRADFIGTSTDLSPSAVEQIERVFELGLEYQPWIVEPSGDSDLDDQRLEHVVGILQSLGAEGTTVAMGRPQAIGLKGPIAEATISNSGFNRFGGQGIGNRGFNSGFGGQQLGGFRR